MGISRPLWGEACLAMGRECAAVAVALVSAKPAEHFRTSPGGYFHGMVAKAKAGGLNLARTLWGMGQGEGATRRGGGERGDAGGGGGQGGRGEDNAVRPGGVVTLGQATVRLPVLAVACNRC